MPLKNDWVNGNSFTHTDQNVVADAVNGLTAGAKNYGLSLSKAGAILTLGVGGAWDEKIMESFQPHYNPILNRYEGVYVGYANSGGTAINAQVGLAYAYHPEGPWTKDSENPIFGGSGTPGDPDRYGTTAPYIRIEQDAGSDTGYTFYLFYCGLSSANTYEAQPVKLCVASADNIYGPWTRHGTIITAGPAASWYDQDIFHPNVVKVDGTYYLFFNASDTTGDERIGYATATDPLGPWTVNATPVLDLGDGGQWDDVRIGDPYLWRFDDAWFMYYYGVGTGNSDGASGAAWCPVESFPDGPWTRHPGNPILARTPGSAIDHAAAFKAAALDAGGRRYVYYTGVGGDPSYNTALALEVGSDPAQTVAYKSAVYGIPLLESVWYRLSPKAADVGAVYEMFESDAIANVFVAGRTCSIAELGLNVTVAGSTGAVIRFGVYELVGDTSIALVADFGTAAATSTGICAKTGTAQVQAGKVYAAVACTQGAAVTRPTVTLTSSDTLQGVSTPCLSAAAAFSSWSGLSISGGASGALPSTGNLGLAGGGVPCLVARVS